MKGYPRSRTSVIYGKKGVRFLVQKQRDQRIPGESPPGKVDGYGD